MDKGSVLCKYYLHGSCNEGTRCLFSHNLSSKPSMLCKYYLQGSCSYGKQCRYDHKKPPPPTSMSTHTSLPCSHHKMTTLPKGGKGGQESTSSLFRKETWMNAVEFVPGRKAHIISGHENSHHSSYANAADVCTPTTGTYYQIAQKSTIQEPLDSHCLSYANAAGVCTSTAGAQYPISETPASLEPSDEMCPYLSVHNCPSGFGCNYLHAFQCDVCQEFCLHPLDEKQQIDHRRQCLEAMEKEMEYSFAVQRSQSVSCSICLEVVMQKESPADRFFGIMENCNHPFCLNCIRKWRGSGKQDKSVLRACPMCRVPSGFVTPSDVWVEDDEEKKDLIKRYHDVLGTKPCRYYDNGKGNCPFGLSCFYKHALPDGSLDRTSPDRRYYAGSECDSSMIRDHKLWHFIEARELRQYET